MQFILVLQRMLIGVFRSMSRAKEGITRITIDQRMCYIKNLVEARWMRKDGSDRLSVGVD